MKDNEIGKESEKREKEAEQAQENSVKFQMREHRIVLFSGIFTLLFTLYILVMGIKYPSSGGYRWIFYLALLGLSAAGIVCCIRGICRGLLVEEMNICYVNWMGKKRAFTLDDIGFCKMDLSGNKDNIVLYDLLGNKLCKLDFGMKGSGELLQYLLDNQVRIERGPRQTGADGVPAIEAFLKETAICEEEIGKCADAFYGKVQALLREWEKQNKSLGAYWEFGYGEFSADETGTETDLWNRTRTMPEGMAELPERYDCIMEAYLKKDNEYVMDRKDKAVCILIPYLVRGYSYQIGERLRIRKTDDDVMLEWMKRQLALLTKELPGHKYHTEPLVLKHELRKTAGPAVRRG